MVTLASSAARTWKKKVVVVWMLLLLLLLLLGSVAVWQTTMMTTTNDDDLRMRLPLLLRMPNNNNNKDLDDTPVVDAPTSFERTPQKTIVGPIFYNLFVPDTHPEAALAIAAEQMQERRWTDPHSHLLYTLIAGDNVTTTNVITDDFCQPHCQRRKHLRRGGDEVDTYQALWRYCQTHPREIVTYLHDRGSFHPKPANTKSRRFGTKAALHCRQTEYFSDDHDHDDDKEDNAINTTTNQQQQQQPQQSCNVCTAKFFTVPQYLTAANMWTAHCSYVRQLLPPKIYGAALQSLYDETLWHPTFRNTTYACLAPPTTTTNTQTQTQTKENHWGLGRYAPERWIVSHPNVRPCNILPGGLARTSDRFPQTWEPRLRPVTQLAAGGGVQHVTSYQALAGRLYEWLYLYGTVPPPKSWIWQAYDSDDLKYGRREEWLAPCLAKTNKTLEQLDRDIVYRLIHENVPASLRLSK